MNRHFLFSSGAQRYMRPIALMLLLAIAFFITLPEAAAQCPMCRATAESNLDAGGTAGRGLNAGILYMLATPYLLVALFAYLWLRNRRKQQEAEKEAVIEN
jgi:hypothetical protein